MSCASEDPRRFNQFIFERFEFGTRYHLLYCDAFEISGSATIEYRIKLGKSPFQDAD